MTPEHAAPTGVKQGRCGRRASRRIVVGRGAGAARPLDLVVRRQVLSRSGVSSSGRAKELPHAGAGGAFRRARARPSCNGAGGRQAGDVWSTSGTAAAAAGYGLESVGRVRTPAHRREVLVLGAGDNWST